MTTEADLQALLDVYENDWQTRLVLADYLEDRGVERADGYRALARQTHYPLGAVDEFTWFDARFHRPFSSWDKSNLPSDWFHLLEPEPDGDHTWVDYKTRQEAEDTAALAFARLPADRRAKLLKQEVLV